MNFSIKNTLGSSSQLPTAVPLDKYTPDTRISTSMLGITSAAGTDYYITKITVSTALTSGNSYKYAFTEVIPMLGDDISSWAVWDGTSEIS